LMILPKGNIYSMNNHDQSYCIVPKAVYIKIVHCISGLNWDAA
jgi:hypothetical protein